MQVIKIIPIKLKWSNWISWDCLKGYDIKVPKEAGVYEVKYKKSGKRLTIGKTVDLNERIKKALIKGTKSHSSGKKIREKEDLSKIIVRWAITNRPSAVEEELQIKYLHKFAKLPKFVRSVSFNQKIPRDLIRGNTS